MDTTRSNLQRCSCRLCNSSRKNEYPDKSSRPSRVMQGFVVVWPSPGLFIVLAKALVFSVLAQRRNRFGPQWHNVSCYLKMSKSCAWVCRPLWDRLRLRVLLFYFSLPCNEIMSHFFFFFSFGPCVRVTVSAFFHPVCKVVRVLTTPLFVNE